jgi:hypothetical protein
MAKYYFHNASTMLRPALKGAAILAALLLLGFSALAADVDGKWTGSVSTPNGDFPQAFTFKADGANLTGSMTGIDGMEIAIKDGKIDGNTLTFSVSLDFGGMPFMLSYKGVLSGEEMKVMGDAMGMPFEFVLKKSK